MQTQCPHCDTRFRVTETQVNLADGFVRCSVCKEVFNAIEIAGQDEHQHSLLDEESTSDNPFSSPLLSNVDSDIQGDDGNGNGNNFENIPEIKADTDVNIEANIKNVDFDKTSATDDVRKDAFDFFDEENNESLSHVVPDAYRNSHDPNRTSVVAGIFWGIGILLLSTTLLAEYLWFNRNHLNQHALLQVWIDEICQQFECKDIAIRDPSQIELVTRNVYSHPNEKEALMINVTLKNNAQFAQPLPVMQVSFSNVRGGMIAARRFLPEEYLPTGDQQPEAQRLHILQPDTNITFTMEIQDPGKKALTYEFDFL